MRGPLETLAGQSPALNALTQPLLWAARRFELADRVATPFDWIRLESS